MNTERPYRWHVAGSLDDHWDRRFRRSCSCLFDDSAFRGMRQSLSYLLFVPADVVKVMKKALRSIVRSLSLSSSCRIELLSSAYCCYGLHCPASSTYCSSVANSAALLLSSLYIKLWSLFIHGSNHDSSSGDDPLGPCAFTALPTLILLSHPSLVSHYLQMQSQTDSQH